MLSTLVDIAGPFALGNGGLSARPGTGTGLLAGAAPIAGTGLPTGTGLPIGTGALAAADAAQGSGLSAYRMRPTTTVRPAAVPAPAVGVVSEKRTTDQFHTPFGVHPSRSPLS